MDIEFLNPFGTERYDTLITETVLGYARDDSTVDITHLRNAPPSISYYYYQHVMETAIFERLLEAEEEDVDAFVIGCCADPGIDIARELVDFPVIVPLEASISLASYFGRDFAIVVDHNKGEPLVENLVYEYGAGANYRGIDTIDWWLVNERGSQDMTEDPEAVADEACELAQAIADDTGAEVIIPACTIIAAMMEKHDRYPEVSVINPNLIALKMAELFADLYRMDAYHLNRTGFYESPRTAEPDLYESIRENFGGYPENVD